MGEAVRTIHGQNALTTFAWVHPFLHPDLRDAVVALLSGQAVVLDDDLEIYALTGADPDRVKLTLLRPGGPFTVSLELRAIRQPGRGGDSRRSIPVPDKWRTTNPVSGVTAWELFNCTVHNVEPHSSAP
ncbi:hypothetical protein JF66_14940 [Cryobacterium sp. MLB-32]|uniref:hypothetical protein n=1 Tax=Cryobacterium sp. MLB-32 TaxID=1529318 RepID=UPI0004E79DAC|nr:hypothetical protein [Cryobacterium sp. MLB-32]KFF58934.1 hypothetical protein JF66_14940 [Cryobacterium sp. MLB-32]